MAFTNPSCSDAVVRSRLLASGEQLDPPARMPALFTCRYRGAPSVGCVFRNGAVMIMPDRCSYEAGPCVYDNLRSAEESGEVAEIVWEWAVVRLVEG